MTKEIKEIERESGALAIKANSFQITTDSLYVSAMEFAKDIKSMEKEVEATFDPIVKKSHAAWKEAIAQKNKYLEPLEKALKILDGKGRNFRREQEEIRIAEQRKAQELADKEATRLAKLAEKAEARGDVAKAEAFAERAEEAAAIVPVIVPNVSKVAGIPIHKVWKAEVTDLMALIKGVTSGDVPLNMVEENKIALKAQAVATKGTLQYPGVRFYPEDSSL